MGRISEGAETFPGGKTGVLAVTQLYTCRCHFRCDANFVYIFIVLDVPKLTRVFVECIIRCEFLFEKLFLICTRNNFLQKRFVVLFLNSCKQTNSFLLRVICFWKSSDYSFHLKHFLSRVWREGLPSDGFFFVFPSHFDLIGSKIFPTHVKKWFLKRATPRALDLGRCRNFPRW